MSTARGRFSSIGVAVALLPPLSALPAQAQVAAGEVTGLVQDPNRQAAPDPAVTVTDVATNRQRVIVTTSDGAYTAASLLPSEYRIDVELSGFRSLRRQGVRLETGEKVRLDFELIVGGVHEQVTVVADAPVVRA